MLKTDLYSVSGLVRAGAPRVVHTSPHRVGNNTVLEAFARAVPAPKQSSQRRTGRFRPAVASTALLHHPYGARAPYGSTSIAVVHVQLKATP